MIRGGAAITASVALLAAAASASAQPASPADVIDQLLRTNPTTAPAQSPPPGEILPSPPTAPPPPQPMMPPPRSAQTAPLPLETGGPTPDGPPTADDLTYDNRLRASMVAQQGLRGPLDGGWSLTVGDREVYVLELSDRKGVVEGAWRDPRRPGVSGFVDVVDRNGETLVLKFAAATASLRGAEGRWAGELREGGAVQAVTLRRRAR